MIYPAHLSRPAPQRRAFFIPRQPPETLEYTPSHHYFPQTQFVHPLRRRPIICLELTLVGILNLSRYLTINTMCIYLWYMKTQVNLKIDPTIKKNAQKRAKELGLSLSSVVNATLSQFARTGELELSSAPRMTPYLEELIAEARKEYKAGKTSGPFSSAEDLMKHLNS